MASKASRLLKSVRLMLARERSYDVSQAEEGKRGRKASKTAYQHRFVGIHALASNANSYLFLTNAID